MLSFRVLYFFVQDYKSVMLGFTTILHSNAQDCKVVTLSFTTILCFFVKDGKAVMFYDNIWIKVYETSQFQFSLTLNLINDLFKFNFWFLNIIQKLLFRGLSVMTSVYATLKDEHRKCRSVRTPCLWC